MLDSPLNKAGLLQVFIRTRKNVLIEVNPHTRIPRTFPRFCGLIVQLLDELKIRSADGNEVLMRVIKNPVTDYLPAGARKVATSSHASVKVDIDKFVAELTKDNAKPAVFVIGSFAKGDVEVDYTSDRISFSEYPLSGALACAKVTCAFEKAWGIL